MRKILSNPNTALGPALTHPIRLLSTFPSRTSKGNRQSQDIIPGDLKATLEAHRASNRAPPIRKINVDLLADPLLEHSGVVPISLLADESSSPQNASVTDHGPTMLEDGSPTEKQGKLLVHRSFSGLDYILPYGFGGKKRKQIHRQFRLTKQRGARNARPLPPVNPARYRHGKSVDLLSVKGDGTRFRPWEDEASQSEFGRMEKLSLEIENLANWMTLTPEEEIFRRELTRATIHAMMRFDNDIEFWTFGSIDTGLASTMSDIDIGFRVRSIQKEQGQRGPSTGLGNPLVRKKTMGKLNKLCIYSIAQPRFTGHEIVYARHPLLRMRHFASSVELQIVAAAPRPSVVEIIRSYLDEYPQLKPIFFCIKSALAARNLDEPRLGGVGSYGLLMMIVAAFKLNFLMQQDSLGKALQLFLGFYANFQTGVKGISIDPPQTFKKRFSFIVASNVAKEQMREDPALWARHQLSVCNEQMPYLLCLQDPSDPFNDLGRSMYRIMDVKETFRVLRNKLQSWLESSSAIHNSFSPLEFLVGPTLEQVRNRRAAFEEWADSEQGRDELEIIRKESVAADSVSAPGALRQAPFDSGKDLSVAEAMGVSRFS